MLFFSGKKLILKRTEILTFPEPFLQERTNHFPFWTLFWLAYLIGYYWIIISVTLIKFNSLMIYDLWTQMEKLDCKIHFHGATNCRFLVDHLWRPTRSYDCCLYLLYTYFFFFHFTRLILSNWTSVIWSSLTLLIYETCRVSWYVKFYY